MAYRDAGQLGGSSDEKVLDLRLAVTSSSREFVPDVYRAIPRRGLDRDLRQRRKVLPKLAEFLLRPRRPKKLHHHHLADRDLVCEDALVEVGFDGGVLMTVRPGAGVCEFQLRRHAHRHCHRCRIVCSGAAKLRQVEVAEVKAPANQAVQARLPNDLV